MTFDADTNLTDGWTFGVPTLAPYESLELARPRSECIKAPRPRPCPLRCRYRLDHSEATCALDVAELGGVTLETIGELFGGLSRERIRQLEVIALQKLRRAARNVK